MARVWHHIDHTTGLWAEWEAGTLPSAESCFRFDFLNQFIGWMHYVGNFVWNETESVAAKYPIFRRDSEDETAYIFNGCDIQPESLWRKLAEYDPLDGTADFAGHIWMDYDASDICKEMQTFENGTILEESEEYIDAAETAEWGAGSIIQPSLNESCPVRNMLLRLRTRLDLCRVVCLGRPNILGQIPPGVTIGYRWNYANRIECLRRWTISSSNPSYPIQPPYVGECESGDELEDAKRPLAYYASSNAFKYGYTDILTNPLIVGRMANGIEDCPHGLLVACTTTNIDSRGPPDPPYVRPANYDLAIWYSETDVDPVGDGVSSNTVEGYGSWTGDACAYGIAYCFYALLLDELPEVFKPSAGFPWEE